MTNEQRNEGHGHVFPRPDGVLARCGGPAICHVCAADLARKNISVRVNQAQPSSKDLSNELRTRYECTAGCTRDIYIPKHRDLDLRAADEIERLNGMIDAMVKFSDSQVEYFNRRLGESNDEVVRLQTEGERLRRELTGANRAIAHFMGPEGGKYIDRFAAMLAGPVSLEESIRKYSSLEPSAVVPKFKNGDAVLITAYIGDDRPGQDVPRTVLELYHPGDPKYLVTIPGGGRLVVYESELQPAPTKEVFRPHASCKTPAACRHEQFCADQWLCSGGTAQGEGANHD